MGLCTLAALTAITMHAQDQKNDWPMTGSDPGQSGWQKDELGLTPESVPANFKYLWKMKLGPSGKASPTFSEPLLIGRVINGQGFKDIVFMTSADTLYAVDSELGNLIWKKQYGAASGSSPCDVSHLDMLMEPPIVINFNARRRRAPGTPRPPEPPPAKSTERKLGVSPGGGYFGFKGIYVLTSDGMLHEQIVTTGADFAPPVKFLPAANASPYGLNFADKTIFTTTAHDCNGIANGLWSINLGSGDYKVSNTATQAIHTLSLTGPVLTPKGASLLVTGPGSPVGDIPANSLVSIAKDGKVDDWFTPQGSVASYEHVSPITFAAAKKQLVVAPGKDGAIALLDGESLGGADHHTPLFETPALTAPGTKHMWDGFAAWTDKSGTTWVYASISSAVTLNDTAVKSNGPIFHGAIVAFKLDESTDNPTLQPAWISSDMVNPAPPRIANGIVVALASGDTSTNAVLHVLNASTGADLYASKNEIPTYTEYSGVAIGDSHAFFTDHDNVLYSFGIPLEH